MITGIVLSGGKSSRMGQDKCLLNFNGKLLISTILDVFKEITDKIFVSANKDEYKNLGYPIIKDAIVNCGPLGGIYSTLKNSTTDINIFAPCDMPFLNAGFYYFLLSQLSDYQAVVPIYNNKVEPLTIILKKETLEIAQSQIAQKDYKILNFLRKINTNFVEITEKNDFFDKKLFININSQGDLEKLKK
jgi:molybdopterin-guanine dinucleotide biosynthesis protein A